MTQHSHANADLEFENWFADNISDSGIAPEHEACQMAWEAGRRAVVAENKRLWENLHGEQAESRRRIAQLERVRETALELTSGGPTNDARLLANLRRALADARETK